MRPLVDSQYVLFDAMSINHLALAGLHNTTLAYFGERVATTDVVVGEVLEPRHSTQARRSFVDGIRTNGKTFDLSAEQLVEAEAMATPRQGSEPKRDIGEMSLIVIARQEARACLIVTDDKDAGIVARANRLAVASTARLVVEMYLAGKLDANGWWRLQSRAFGKRNRREADIVLADRAQRLESDYGW